TESKIWLRLCLSNQTSDVSEWRLYTHENFFQAYAVFLKHPDGRINTVVDLQENSPFSARPIADPELVAPLVIAPGKRVQLLISYWSGGSSKVDFSIQTKASFDELEARKTAKNFFFYGMMILLITIAFLSLLLTRQPVFLAYCGYALFALLFVMHGDGVAFQFLWPNLPLFNSNASILTGGGLIIFGAVYARVFLRTRERTPWLDKVLLTMIALTVGLIITLSPLNTQLLKQILVAISLVSFLVFAISGLIVYFSGYRDVRFYTLAWVGAMVAVTLMFLRHFSNIEIPQAMVHDSMRSVMVLDAFMMGLAIADRYNQLRKSRQNALEANLNAAQRSLNLNRRLADLQTRHELAVEMAKTRDKQIQNVVHDLRQPLHALRLSIMTPQDTEPGAAQRIESSFNYLETLIAEHLEAGPGPTMTQPVDDEPINRLGLQDVLSAVAEMFRIDAEEKGLELTLRPSSIDAEGDALVLTRILSNLVSNAVKYTARGRILIGTRRQNGQVRVEIHDTGPGMSAAEFAEASKRNVRLKSGKAQAEGSGLGLAIAVDLAKRHGMRIERCGTRKSGLGLALVLGSTATAA
ncbi:MAG: 7TM diverse intracellular signaling domain-containing protein, partial [Arenibacterium sp.]